MAETSIQWTATPRPDGTFAPGYTFNPWIGCAKVSPGCKHCYASVDTFARVSSSRGLPLWGEDAHRHVTSDENWRKPLRWNREAAAMGERRKVFCASLADVFEARDDLDAHRARLWELINKTPHLDWLLLTKRPEEILRRIPERWRAGLPANVWIGTTVESQAAADERIPHLLRVPARVRFLSCEPLLERVDLRRIDLGASIPIMLDDGRRAHVAMRQYPDGSRWTLDALGGIVSRSDAAHPVDSIGWVIIGGESGAKARPFDVAWPRDIAQQCRAASVPVFMKQAGSNPQDHGTGLDWPEGVSFTRGVGPGSRVLLVDRAGGDPAEWPEDLRIRRFPEVAT